MPKLIDITDRRFGRLLVLQLDHKEPRPRGSRVFWRCLCDCGKDVIVAGDKLKSGHSRSCGCFGKDRRLEVHTKHGHAKAGQQHKTWICWVNMRRRCQNINHSRYADWGGRGIVVCERWQDYRNFLADMGEKPGGMSLDRIN